MGISIFLYQYSRYSGLSVYEKLADDLLDSVYSHISEVPLSFVNGLAGIGWAIHYLSQNHFISIESGTLEEIDLFIRRLTTQDFISETKQELPLFSKGLYFGIRPEEDLQYETLCECEEFLGSVAEECYTVGYLNSILFFLSLLPVSFHQTNSYKLLMQHLYTHLNKSVAQKQYLPSDITILAQLMESIGLSDNASLWNQFKDKIKIESSMLSFPDFGSAWKALLYSSNYHPSIDRKDYLNRVQKYIDNFNHKKVALTGLAGIGSSLIINTNHRI